MLHTPHHSPCAPPDGEAAGAVGQDAFPQAVAVRVVQLVLAACGATGCTWGAHNLGGVASYPLVGGVGAAEP